MRRCRWLPALLGLTAALPAVAQEGLRIGDAVSAALAGHRSVAAAEGAVRSAALALRLAELDAGRTSVSVSATPAAGVELATLQTDTVAAEGSATVGAAVALPWGMELAGSYTAAVNLTGTERNGAGFVDMHSVSVSQELLSEGRLAPEALAVAERGDQLRLAGLRLQRTRNEVVLQAAQTFLTLAARAAAVTLLEERLALAERDLTRVESRVAQQAADRLEALDAAIAVAEQRNSLEELRAALALDTGQFFADLGFAPQPLIAPAADLAALRSSAHALLAEPTPPSALAGAPAVREAEAALRSAELQAERAQRGVLPELSLSLDYRKPRSAPRLGSLSLSVTGSYALFDGGRNAVAADQAQEQAAAARRSLEATRIEVAGAFRRARLELTSALAAEELARLRQERARLRLEQARRRHAAGAVSDTALQEAVLLLREAEDAAGAAALALGGAYLALAIDLRLDLQRELAAIVR